MTKQKIINQLLNKRLAERILVFLIPVLFLLFILQNISVYAQTPQSCNYSVNPQITCSTGYICQGPGIPGAAGVCVQITPTPASLSYCSLKSQGDANCDGKVDISDYNLWTQQFDTLVPASPPNQNSNFMCVEGNTTTYFTDLVDFEIWRRTTSGLITPAALVTLRLDPVTANLSVNGTAAFKLIADFPKGSSSQKLDYFKAQITFPTQFFQMPAGQYIDTSTSGFGKIFRVDGPTAANQSGTIVIELGADLPGAGPSTDKSITVATLTLQGKAQTSPVPINIVSTAQVVDNQSQALSVTTTGAVISVQ